jgi:hypothetical protein
MLRKWTGADVKGDIMLEDLPRDTQRLTLHIISRIGFGVRLLWPGEAIKERTSVRDAAYSSFESSRGTYDEFEDALTTLLEQLLWVLLTSNWLLSKLGPDRRHIQLLTRTERIPTKGAQLACESYVNWGQYMNELFEQKVQEAREGKKSEEMDILGSLVKTAYGQESASSRKPSPCRAEKGEVGTHS